MTFKNPEMDKTLKNGVKYDWNKSPQPQMVGFWNLVGTDIAPVSKKTAVKTFLMKEKWKSIEANNNNKLQMIVHWCKMSSSNKVIFHHLDSISTF